MFHAVEILGILLGLVVFVAVLTVTIVLPIVAFVRTLRIKKLDERIGQLEREIRRLRQSGWVEPEAPASLSFLAERIAVGPHPRIDGATSGTRMA